MPSSSDREVAISAFSEAIEGREREWFRDFRYDPRWASDSEFREQIGKFLKGVCDSLGWGNWSDPEIPAREIPRMIVLCFGSNILNVNAIVDTLALHVIPNLDDIGKEEIASALNCESETDAILGGISNWEFRRSTNLALKICCLLGLPASYSSGGGSDDRPRFERTIGSEKLHPLMPFQEVVYSGVMESIEEENGRCLVVMPTGAGKTRTTVHAVIDSINDGSIPPRGIVWLADRDELCEQSVETFKLVADKSCPSSLYLWRYWRGNEIDLMPSESGNRIEGIVVSSVQQFGGRFGDGDPTANLLVESSRLIIIDEAHRNLGFIKDLNNQLKQMENKPTLVGITATPFRREEAESGALAKIFGWSALTPYEGGAEDPEMVTKKLEDDKILAKRIDTSPEELGVVIREGGVHDSHLAECIEIVKALMERDHKSILVFTPTVDFAKRGAAILSIGDKEIKADYLDASTSVVDRREVIRAFKNGEVRVLFNCEILTTGFDAPKTDAVVISRPALKQDDPLFKQMVGRGLRGTVFGEGTPCCTVVHHKW